MQEPGQQHENVDGAENSTTAAPAQAARGGYGEALLWCGLLGLLANAIELWSNERILSGLGALQLIAGAVLTGLLGMLMLRTFLGRHGCGLLLGVHIGLMLMGGSVRALSLLLTGQSFGGEEPARMTVYGLVFAFGSYVLIALATRRWLRA